MYLVMADSREKIIGVSDTETGARHAGRTAEIALRKGGAGV